MLLLGDDWAEAHHDMELQDEHGRVLVLRRLPEGVAGLAQLHAVIADHLGEADEPGSVVVGIETDRGPWVQALIAAHTTSGRETSTRPARPARDVDPVAGSRRRGAPGDVIAAAAAHRETVDRQRVVYGLEAQLPAPADSPESCSLPVIEQRQAYLDEMTRRNPVGGPELIEFHLVRGPVPHVVEQFLLTGTGDSTELRYVGELATDGWSLGARWGDRVAGPWQRTVLATFLAVKTEAERRTKTGRRRPLSS